MIAYSTDSDDAVFANECKYARVPTSSGNHGKRGKSLKKVPCMEKPWNLKKTE